MMMMMMMMMMMTMDSFRWSQIRIIVLVYLISAHSNLITQLTVNAQHKGRERLFIPYFLFVSFELWKGRIICNFP